MPIPEVCRLQARGSLVALERLEIGIVSGKSVSNAEVRKKGRSNKSKGENKKSLCRTGKARAHSTVLCLGGVAVARQNSLTEWTPLK